MPNYSALTTFLKNEDDHVLHRILESTTLQTSDAISEAAVHFLAYHRLATPYIKKLIGAEVAEQDSEALLFRGTSMVSQLISGFLDLNGKTYLRSSAIVDILSHIFKSVQGSPNFSKEVALSVVGSALFVRFLCPALVNFKGASSTEGLARNLILLAKVIQNVSLNKLFKSRREKAFTPLNQYIEPLFADMNTFLEKVVTTDLASLTPPKVSKHQLQRSLQTFSKYLTENGERVSEAVEDELTPEEDDEDEDEGSSTSTAAGNTAGSLTEEEVQVQVAAFMTKVSEVLTALAEATGSPDPDLAGIESETEEESEDDWFASTATKASETEIEDDPRIVLNAIDESSKETEPDPVGLSGKCLTSITRIFHDIILPNKQENVGQGDWKDSHWIYALEKSQYADFCALVADIQVVDLNLLKPNERTAFLLNIFHTMLVHVYIVYGQPSNSLRRRSFFKSFQYRIGKYLFTLNDIRYGVILANKRRQFSKKDERRKFSFENLDPRFYFCLSYLTDPSPAVRLYASNSLEETINYAVETSLAVNMEIDTTKKKIFLPAILSGYKADFLADKTNSGREETDNSLKIMNVLDSFGAETPSEPNKGASKEERLIRWTLPYLTPARQKALRQLLNSKARYEIRKTQLNWTTVPKFSYTILGLSTGKLVAQARNTTRFCLNDAQKWVGKTRKPWIVTSEILKQVANIYNEFHQTAMKTLEDAPPPMVTSPSPSKFSLFSKKTLEPTINTSWEDGPTNAEAWRNLMVSLTELQEVDIDSMTPQQTMATFLNLYHILYIHIVASLGVKFLAKARYKIGTSTFSLADIYDGILRANSPSGGHLFGKGKTYFEKNDLRQGYSLITIDPRFYAATSGLLANSPKIRNFTPDNVEDNLAKSIQEYLQRNVVVSSKPKSNVANIKLPKLLDRHRSDFGAKTNEELFNNIIDLMDPSLQNPYKKIITDGKKLSFKFFDEEKKQKLTNPGFSFDLDQIFDIQTTRSGATSIKLVSGVSSSTSTSS